MATPSRSGQQVQFEGRRSKHQRFAGVSLPGVHAKEWEECTVGQDGLPPEERLAFSCVFYPDDSTDFFGVHTKTGSRTFLGFGRTPCKCHQLYSKLPDFSTWPNQQATFGCKWFDKWCANLNDVRDLDQLPVIIYKRCLAGDDEAGLGQSQRGELEEVRTQGLPFLGVDVDEFCHIVAPVARTPNIFRGMPMQVVKATLQWLVDVSRSRTTSLQQRHRELQAQNKKVQVEVEQSQKRLQQLRAEAAAEEQRLAALQVQKQNIEDDTAETERLLVAAMQSIPRKEGHLDNDSPQPSLDLRAWGVTDHGQCSAPALPPGQHLLAVSAGYDHSLGLTADGQILAWGRDDKQQCTGQPSLAAGDRWVAVSAGRWHSLGLSASGALHTWGDKSCELGATPALQPGERWLAISVGAFHSLALTNTGRACAWGRQDHGRCAVPVLPPGEHWICLSAGGYHSLGITSSGALKAWGFDGQGQCSKIPTLPSGDSWAAASAGGYHSLALTSGGELHCFGWNVDNQCSPPVLPKGVRWVAVSAGWRHSLGMTSTGQLLAWGQNDCGQCNVPTLAPGQQWQAISAGSGHSVALASAAPATP